MTSAIFGSTTSILPQQTGVSSLILSLGEGTTRQAKGRTRRMLLRGRKDMRRIRLLLAATVLALSVGGLAVASASIPDSAGVIHGCYKTSNPARGALVVIDTDAGQTCPSGTSPLNWNQTGPQGPVGPAGPQGAQGPAGSAGISNIHVLPAVPVCDPAFCSTTNPIMCPTGENALSISFWQDGQVFIITYSSRPVLDTNDRPVGYSWGASYLAGWAYVTCATVA